MRFHARHLYRYALVGGALVALSCAPGGAWAQQDNTQNAGQMQGQAQGQFQAQGNVHWSDWAAFDQFLDAHPDIAEALRANPDLIDDQGFMGQHQDLKSFCDMHPGVRQDMRQDRARFSNWFRIRTDLATMNRFLSSHTDIAQQLEANPKLLDDTNYLRNHPELLTFLNNNRTVRDAFDRNPSQFMNMEQRFEARLNGRPGIGDQGYAGNGYGQNPNPNRQRNPNPDLTQTQVASADQFFDSHQNIEKQLQSNPSLVNDQTFLNNNPQLRDFLNNNPQIREEFDENPSYFMQREARYENSPADRVADNGGRGVNPGTNPGQNGNPNPDLTRGEVAATAQFFQSHPDLEKQLQSSPDLVNNQNFLQQHPELQEFLNSHPQVREEFDETPVVFMNAEVRFQGGPTVVAMDEFLSANPQVAKQLEANPSLINDAKYLQQHPELRDVLNNNPRLRDMFTQNPSTFLTVAYRDNDARGGRADVATMDQYLDKHPGEARDLDAYPARVNDSDYLAHHKDLEAFLKKHPDVRDEFTHNPSSFMHQESTFDACAQMDDFLNNHKSLAKDLDSNPNNVKDDNYLNHHKDLKSFLAKNPGVGDQFEGNPSGFMDQERKFEANRQFDVYLSAHKSVAKELQKNPDQVKDAKYLDHHKDLKEMMDKHPELAQAANANPSTFMHEQMQFHEQYKHEHVQEKTKVEQRATTHGPQ